MNIADYLSELLVQHNEISVPGLGYFARARVNAYYNETEDKFYPPHYEATFTPQAKDDDIFVEYVARKKNISLASSKYFTEKFIAKLKEDAASGPYLFSDLGVFRIESGEFIFTPTEKSHADPAFYGYPPISIHKLSSISHTEPPTPVYAESVYEAPISAPSVAAPEEQTIEPEEYYEEETELRKASVWLIVLLSLTAIGLAVFGFYQYDPTTFHKLNTSYHKIIGKKDTVAPANGGIKKNAAKTDSVNKDTSAKITTPAIDTANQLHFEIIAGKYFHPWQKDQAATEVERYKGLGLDAKISTDVPGLQIKISVGTYFTQKEADSVRTALIASGKIPKNSHQLVKINPK